MILVIKWIVENNLLRTHHRIVCKITSWWWIIVGYLDGSGGGLSEYYHDSCLVGLKKTMINFSHPTEIRTEHLPTMSLERYRHAKLVDMIMITCSL
jgi:hypothetical protein